MKKITCFQISTVLLLSYSTLAFSATIGFDSGSAEGLIGTGLSGTINDGAASTSFNVEVVGVDTSSDGAQFFVNEGTTDPNAPADTLAAFQWGTTTPGDPATQLSTGETASSKITFGQAMSGLVVRKPNPAISSTTSDSIQWTLSWVSASGASATFTDNNTRNDTTANVYDPSGNVLGSTFNSGDSFYFDKNGDLNETRGSGLTATSNSETTAYDFEFVLPDEITELTYTYTYTRSPNNGDPQRESLGLSFAGATIVPEPSSTALLGLGLAFPILRRNRKK